MEATHAHRTLSFYVGVLLALGAGAVASDPGNNVLWQDPGAIESFDFTYGPGGPDLAPKPPFTFVKEDTSGTSPKAFVKDRDGREYNVKFAYEAHGETFGARMMWALGYYIEPAYFVQHGRLSDVPKKLSERLRREITEDGSFFNARFQWRDPSMKFLQKSNWAWVNNPFRGTHEMNGLKILIMLVSNWDNKDARDEDEGINTAIFEKPGDPPQHIYTFTDWGQSLGGWGQFTNRAAWNCKVFTNDTAEFVSFVNGKVHWGYGGRHADFKEDVTLDDARWAMQYLGRISDDQLRAGILASGADENTADCFAHQLRRRIELLRSASGHPSVE
jgi:hypothetical protein